MLTSTTHYRVKVTKGKLSGYDLTFEQECFFCWLFRFWAYARSTNCSTITYAATLIIKMEEVYGPLDILDFTNSLTA